MKCPACTEAVLVMTERQGVEIDYCPQCRGVWLDRGELDTLLERAEAPPARPARPYREAGDRDDAEDRDDWNRHGQRRESWLSNIVD